MKYENAYYNEGSTARKLKTAERTRRNEERKEYVAPSKRRSRGVQITPLYAMMVIGAVIVMAVASMGYVSLQSQVTNLRNEKGRLVSEYEELKVSNDLYYENMVSAIDIKEVERIAVEELGMKMAGQGQVMTYADDFDDYVKQYADVPN